MERILIVTALSLTLAGAASSASLGVQIQGGGNVGLFNIGDPITLEITANVADGEPGAGVSIFLRGNGSVQWTGAVQTPLTTLDGAAPYTLFPLICSGTHHDCLAVSQRPPNQPSGSVETDAFDGVLATVVSPRVTASSTSRWRTASAMSSRSFRTRSRSRSSPNQARSRCWRSGAPGSLRLAAVVDPVDSSGGWGFAMLVLGIVIGVQMRVRGEGPGTLRQLLKRPGS